MTAHRRRYMKEYLRQWNGNNPGKHAAYNRKSRQRRRQARILSELRRIRTAVRLLDRVVGNILTSHTSAIMSDRMR